MDRLLQVLRLRVGRAARRKRDVLALRGSGGALAFLLDQARYLNHFYLVILIAFLMVLVPAHHAFAVDAALRPGWRRDTVPAWAVWLFRLQFEIMYIIAGIVEINADWLRLEPLGMWLANHEEAPFIGELLVQGLAPRPGLEPGICGLTAFLHRSSQPSADNYRR